MKDTILAIFKELNDRMILENNEREKEGVVKLRPVEVRILGQVTLLANEMATQILPL
ncbi:MAG: hypothetical protein H6625_08990 [Bdellovibrionaceae bacterium]|nr:hypothetical protein [Pseudobdellovibrionaceae bacterium]